MKQLWSQINKRTFLAPAIFFIIVLIIAFVFPTQFADAMNTALNWSLSSLGWVWLLSASFFLLVLLWLAFGKAGNIRFGGKDAVPDLPTWKWFCIVLTSGMAAGCCYYGVTEPLSFFLSPPAFSGAEAGSAVAAEQSLRYVFLHWCLHPYAIYTIPSIAVGFMYWNGKRRFSLGAGLYPFFGAKADGRISDWTNALALAGIMGGCTTVIGLSSDQLVVGLKYVTGWEISADVLAVIICLIFVVPAILAAVSGLHKGIALISTTNMYIYIFICATALLLGGNAKFVIDNTVSSIGQYFQFAVGQSLYLEPAQQTGWVSGWTIFYFAWWLVACPLVGLFQVKMAKGRTLREFILVNMLAPCIFAVAWFGFIGSSAIKMVLDGNTELVDVFQTLGSSGSLFAWMKQLPFSGVICIAGFLAVLFSVITCFESQIMTATDLCLNQNEVDTSDISGNKKASVVMKIFWGVIVCGMGFALRYSKGGLNSVKTSSVIIAIPTTVLVIALAFAAIKIFRNPEKYDKTLEAEEDCKKK